MNLLESFPNRIESFIKAANLNQLKMILEGGGAVNYHGYQRHSADLDFWIEISSENLEKLLATLHSLGYQVENLPEEVKKGEQNISINISPVFDIELITNFNFGKTFREAFNESEIVDKAGFNYRVLSFNDLVESKISSSRSKDRLDVEELHKIQLRKNKKISCSREFPLLPQIVSR